MLFPIYPSFGFVRNFVCAFVLLWLPVESRSQLQQVISATGGHQTTGNLQLSFTVGESVTQTLTQNNLMLTQGFQQPFTLRLNLRAFIQGYYSGNHQMNPVLYNQGVYPTPGTVTDTIQVSLHDITPPYSLLYQKKALLGQDGWATLQGVGVTGQFYYIAISHRNCIQTWSANPVLLTGNTQYDFSTAASKAFGNNQTEVDSGIWALYSGELNADDNIDLLDLTLVESDIEAFAFGYFATDLNGDGNVDLLDNPIVETNTNLFIYAIKP